ncbi:PAS domain-containing protein [Jannaschia rubra]|uniref:histidine kinase n=1 Tax=Jannaschia rubra TaxID=282197 RepID=A0A0M6XLU1_9RHOB|nr:PAS domain-containing protein [Jannaschia rubra]CTQ31537.1 Blue-light-activated histidine kinase 1 [Jannaschia rubra]SFF77617.1 PAS domain S-box-containing protein [Jannaschia rubra]
MKDTPRPSTRTLLQTIGLERLIEHARLPLCISDPSQEDNPIVYANPAFSELTGYSSEEVVGRNCRFLQGPETTPESVEQIRRAIREQAVTTVEIVNYRKDGRAFVNALQIGPVHDDTGETVLFFGSQLDISERRAEELQRAQLETSELLHRLRNIVNVMSVVIRMSAREETDVTRLVQTVTERLHALSDAHFRTFDPAQDAGQPLDDLLQTILHAYAPGGASQVAIAGAAGVTVPRQVVTALTLALHELATNAVKHGSLSAPEGRVRIDVSADPEGRDLALRWTESGGPPVQAPDRASGSRIIQQLTRSAGGGLDYDWQASGLTVRISFAL